MNVLCSLSVPEQKLKTVGSHTTRLASLGLKDIRDINTSLGNHIHDQRMMIHDNVVLA